MLAGNLVEEFEMTENDPWYDHQDLQQDLRLAAELGKTLLDRNTELEDSLHQMRTANEEQLQEIEHLNKQVELLRQVNEQHAKVYEQLDITARELEDTNQKLVAESRASQQKVQSLTETVECLQANVDHLQRQVEELQSSGQGRGSPGQCSPAPAPSLAGLKELYDLRQHFVYDHVFAEQIAALPGQPSADEEEHRHLKRAARALQAQLSLERQRRGALEEELAGLLEENAALERQLGAAGAFRARAQELEAEVAEMRRALRAERPFENGVDALVPDSFFVPFREPGRNLLDELLLPAPAAPRRPLKRSSSETALSSLAGGDAVRGHEETCVRRARAVRQRGVSLLHEVDAQYSALQAKYEELLSRCRRDGDALAHKAVQTARAAAREPAACAPEPAPAPAGSPTSTPPPEYKALFQEIFSCIQKTKQEIDEQRTKYRSLPSPS